ncbi:hypothetical protein HanRHA438_Chr17g0836991 [Helianthus annuus]|nr:hypothetical protein HanIR_Chr17g0897761 [Helianthus annuus]KAJ0449251.1 hypothetical protein HanHA89_Chr17g0726311 [Helianthus annuus]KAJ0634110.1 hypothetical protein HanLR1_Chr17g0684441 [Helianthus annuus]KAJ0828421.1 hypothetical protein HanRHA438_Chr17g0836991 [Helianthus annuus]
MFYLYFLYYKTFIYFITLTIKLGNHFHLVYASFLFHFSLFTSANTIDLRSTIRDSRLSATLWAIYLYPSSRSTSLFVFVCVREPFANTLISLMNEHEHKISFGKCS